MIGGKRLIAWFVLTVLVAGCATTTPESDRSGRTGMNRVSPVQSADVNTRLGVGYFERGELQIAIEKLERAIELDPAHVPAHVTLALAHERLGRTSRARRHYERAVELAPEDGGTLNSYAAFLCRQGEYRRAEEHFERAIDDPFYDAPEVIHANAGACALRSGELASAESHLREALEHDASYPDALYHLARLYLERDEAFRARAFLQRYESSAGDSDPEVLSLGYRIERQLGNRQQAARYMQRLEEDFPDSSEARDIRRQISQDD